MWSEASREVSGLANARLVEIVNDVFGRDGAGRLTLVVSKGKVTSVSATKPDENAAGRLKTIHMRPEEWNGDHR